MINILVTGAGAPGIKGTLFSIRNNPDKKNVKLVGVDIEQEPVGQYFVDVFYQVPRPEDSDYADRIIDICKKEQIHIIVPQTTREIEYYSKNQKIFLDQNIKVMVAPAEAIKISNNKYETVCFFEKMGLPVAQYKLVKKKDEFLAAYKMLNELGGANNPVVVKAPFSNGMRGLRIIKDEPWDIKRFLSDKPNGVDIDLESFLNMMGNGAWPELLICEYLPGMEYSVDAFIGKKSKIAVPRQRVKIRSGISFVNKIEMGRKDLVNFTLEAASAMGMYGVFGFQYKLDGNGVAKVLECNPRIQGTMVASTLAGANIIWFGIKETMGETVEFHGHIHDDLMFMRYWGGVSCINDELYNI